jgi:Tfp pilus assembly protein PilV
VTAVRRSGRGRDDGMLLVEVLVSMLLMGVVMSLTTAFFTQGVWVTNYTNSYEQQVFALRQGLQRMTQEVRTASLVETSSTGTSLTFWVDANHDYVEQPGEVITYALVTSTLPGGATTAELRRYTQASGANNYSVIARGLVPGTVFGYDVNGVAEPLGPTTNGVQITLTAQVQKQGVTQVGQAVSTLVELRG